MDGMKWLLTNDVIPLVFGAGLLYVPGFPFEEG